jgi:hypothetical protein
MLSAVRSLSDRHCSLTSLARHKAKMAAFSGMVLVTMLLMVIVNRPSTGQCQLSTVRQLALCHQRCDLVITLSILICYDLV